MQSYTTLEGECTGVSLFGSLSVHMPISQPNYRLAVLTSCSRVAFKAALLDVLDSFSESPSRSTWDAKCLGGVVAVQQVAEISPSPLDSITRESGYIVNSNICYHLHQQWPCRRLGRGIAFPIRGCFELSDSTFGDRKGHVAGSRVNARCRILKLSEKILGDMPQFIWRAVGLAPVVRVDNLSLRGIRGEHGSFSPAM